MANRTPLTWLNALTIRERCEWADRRSASADNGDVGRANWWDRWLASVGFRGNRAAFEHRIARIGALPAVQKAVEADPETWSEVHPDALPEWAVTLDRLYVREPWPGADAVSDSLLRGHPAGEDADIRGPLGWVALASPLLIECGGRLRVALEQLFAASPDPAASTERFLDLVWPAFVLRVADLLTRVVVLELNVDRVSGRLSGDTPEERFHSFVDSILDGRRSREIALEYPVLMRRLLECVERTEGFVLDLGARLTADRDLLGEAFGIPVDAGLTGVSLDSGDTHRGGQAVSILTFEGDLRVVYKPRSLAVDVAFGQLVEWYSDAVAGPDGLDLAIPAVVDRGDYGWAEFIAAQPCEDADAVERFYLRQGLLLSLLHALGGSDFHYENIIARGEHPYLIDLETLFHRIPDVPAPDFLPDGEVELQRAFGASVIQVGLLPLPLWGTSDRPGVDFSGLGGEEGQALPVSGYVLAGQGTDSMRMERNASGMLTGQSNRPTIRGEAVRTEDYQHCVREGFACGYNVLAARHREAAEFVRAFDGCDLRFIVRHTATYARLLTESTHPDFNRDGRALDIFLDGVWAAAHDDPSLDSMIEAEREDMQNGDVPFFTIDPATRDLSHGGRTVRHHYFRQGGIASSIAKLANFSGEDAAWQQWLIAASYASRGVSSSPRADVPRGVEYNGDTLTGSELRDAVHERVAAHAAHLVQAMRGRDHPSWPTLIPGAGSRWHLASSNESLYHGKAGVGLFLHRAGTALNDGALTDLAHRTLTSSLSRLEGALQGSLGFPSPMLDRVGLHDGAAGVLFAGYSCGQLDAGAVLDISRHLLDAAPHSSAGGLDVISGVGGLLCLLGTIRGAHPNPGQVDDVVDRCADLIAAGIGEGASALNPGHAFGHGTGGVLAAYPWHHEGLGAVLRPLIHESKNTARGEGPGMSPLTGGWCRGAAGALAAQQRYQRLGTPTGRAAGAEAVALEVLNSWATGDPAALFTDDSLCHGTASACSLAAAAAEGGPGADRARGLRDAFASLLVHRLQAGEVRSLAPGGVPTPGLMDGTSGVCLALLEAVGEAPAGAVLAAVAPGGATGRIDERTP